MYAVTGATCSVVAGRVSFVLGMKGPAVAVNTVCSSSLVASHSSLRALQRVFSTLRCNTVRSIQDTVWTQRESVGSEKSTVRLKYFHAIKKDPFGSLFIIRSI